MDCMKRINLAITLPFSLDVHALWLQLTYVFRLPLKLGIERGCCILKAALEQEH